MKNKLILSALTVALLSACGSSDNNGAAPDNISPVDSSAPSAPSGNNGQDAATPSQEPETPATQQPANPNPEPQSNVPDNSQLNNPQPNNPQPNNPQPNNPQPNNPQPNNPQPNNPQPNNPQPNNPQPNNPQPNNSGAVIENRNINLVGEFTVIPKKDTIDKGVSRETEDNTNQAIGTIRLPDFAADAHQGGILSFNNTKGKNGHPYTNFQVSDNSYRHSQFGVIDDDPEYIQFIRRETTAVQLPNNGTARYSGDSIVSLHDSAQHFMHRETGTVAATADFGNKNMTVNLNSPSHTAEIRDINITSDNASFRKDEDGRMSIGGAFAGAQAEELVGSYARFTGDKRYIYAVFGGKRQGGIDPSSGNNDSTSNNGSSPTTPTDGNGPNERIRVNGGSDTSAPLYGFYTDWNTNKGHAQTTDRYRDTITLDANRSFNDGRDEPMKLPSDVSTGHHDGFLTFGAVKTADGRSYRSFQVSDNSFLYTQIGAFDPVDNRGHGEFARGHRTIPEAVPARGDATYKGSTILNFYDQYVYSPTHGHLRTETGSATLTTNFTDKTFNLSLATPTYHNSVDGVINGSALLAPDMSNPNAVRNTYPGASVMGFFAGPKAEEAYGVYRHAYAEGGDPRPTSGVNDERLATGVFAVKR